LRIVDRYVLKEIAAPLVTWVVFLFALLTVMQLLRSSDVLFGSAVTLGDLGGIVLALGPHFLVMTLPVSFLLAVLLGLGRLAEDRELTALESLGRSPFRLLAVPLLLGALLGGGLFALSASAEPHGLVEAKHLVSDVIKKNVIGDVKPGVFYDDLSELVLYAEKIDKKAGTWTHVLLHDERDRRSPLLVLAERGKVNPSGPGAALTLSLEDGAVHRIQRAGPEYTMLRFRRADVAIGVQESITRKNRFRSPEEELTPGELLEAAQQARAHRRPAEPFLTAFHLRLGELFTPLAFALVGGPLAMSRRQARGRSYLLTLGAYVLYYVLTRTFENLGDHGRMAPWLAGELTNFIFAAAGAIALFRMARPGRA
jgi:lipopolysaccharide export system permease protein